jgi:magnesium chelatase subunit H
LELSNLKELVNEYRTNLKMDSDDKMVIREAIWSSCQRCGFDNDVPLPSRVVSAQLSSETLPRDSSELPKDLSDEDFDAWVLKVSDYLTELQDRLFSSGLHTLGAKPSEEEIKSYLQAYYGDKFDQSDYETAFEKWRMAKKPFSSIANWIKGLQEWLRRFMDPSHDEHFDEKTRLHLEAARIVDLLDRNTEELDNLMIAIGGGYVPPAPGGDLLRDGTAVLPTGRNIHALDPYRMPSALAWEKGMKNRLFM